MQIDKNIIDEITRKADIVDVISRGLKLKRSGNNYFACCPFHKEKSPSFSINAKEQYFHCFGCGESGDVITYVMKYNGLDFIEAVKSLANSYGVHIPEGTRTLTPIEIKQEKIKKATLQDVIVKTVDFYRNNLVHSSVAINYLKNRGLTQNIIDKFLLGFVPSQSTTLGSIFADYSTNTFLLDAGLVIKGDNGKLYDRFRERIMFPIRNTRGEVIAFGGRIIAKGEPKYLNSPETVLFNKSNELYGLYEAQRQIRDTNKVVVVEGYMDVIALSQFGVDNVVATMGTAATEEHVKKMFRLCDDIYYCFDGDHAGKKAAWRALERSLPLVTDNKCVHFLFLPEEHDPDSFIRERGADVFKIELQDNCTSLSGFLLSQLSSTVNLQTEEGKARFISLVKPYIEQVKAVALAVMLKKQLANLVELNPDVVESILNNRSRYAFYNSKWNKNFETEKKPLPTPLNVIELVINNARNNLSWVYNYRLPDYIADYSREVQEMVLILDFISNNYTDGDSVTLGDIRENIEFTALNIEKIFMKDVIGLTEDDFKSALDKIFGFAKTKAIKIPMIPMKGSL